MFRSAWLATGFRPFFLLASALACVATGTWLHALTSSGDPSAHYLPPMWWHAHEMVFGFAMAVVAGFLLTATRNWTRLDTLHGGPLFALAAIWLLARVTLVVPLPTWLRGLPTLAFMAVLTFVIARVLVRAQSRRNYGIALVLGVLTVAATLVHLEAMGIVRGVTRPTLEAAVHLIVLLNVVIGGRIIPLFTRNRTGVQTRSVRGVDLAALACAALIIPASIVRYAWPEAGIVLVPIAAASGIVQLLRMRTWGFRAALRVPMLAILFAGYTWIGVGHLLLAASAFVPSISHALALHALTIGVIGTMTLGMMARVSLGHTGREIRASGPVKLAFVVITLAVVARLSAAVLPPELLPTSWLVAGSLFGFAYLLLLIAIWTPLRSARPDGRPG